MTTPGTANGHHYRCHSTTQGDDDWAQDAIASGKIFSILHFILLTIIYK
jgi:hypothetical protein